MKTMQDLVDAHQQDQKVKPINHGPDERHRILAERLSYLRQRVANPGVGMEAQRLAALESDVLLILGHLTGQHPEASDSPGCSAMPRTVETQ